MVVEKMIRVSWAKKKRNDNILQEIVEGINIIKSEKENESFLASTKKQQIYQYFEGEGYEKLQRGRPK